MRPSSCIRGSGKRRATWPASPIRWWTAASARTAFAPTIRESRGLRASRTPKCPVCGTRGSLTEPRLFNLMFKTFMGPVEESAAVVYLRPETAQGIYVNYLNVLQSSRQKIPFGIAQIGKAFRNEITPGNFIFRTREFEQMEMQFFVQPGTDAEWFERWREWRMEWHRSLGLDPAQAPMAPARPGASWRTTPSAAFDIQYSFHSAGRRSREFTTEATSTSAATRSTPARSWSTSTRRRTALSAVHRGDVRRRRPGGADAAGRCLS